MIYIYDRGVAILLGWGRQTSNTCVYTFDISVYVDVPPCCDCYQSHLVCDADVLGSLPCGGWEGTHNIHGGFLNLEVPPCASEAILPSLQIQPLLDCRPSLHLSLAVGTSILVCRPLPLQFAYSDAEPERPTFEALLDR